MAGKRSAPADGNLTIERFNVEKTKMQLTSETGSCFWNDSCSIRELSEAVAQGAVGATSNPVIVFEVIKKEESIWRDVIKDLQRQYPEDTDAETAWKLIEIIGKEATKILYPVYESSGGRRGRLSLQVNPEFYASPQKMIDHALHLSQVAPNLAIKIPCTSAGLKAVEEVTSRGIVVNVTVSFTVPQAIAAAESIERGLVRAEKNGIDISRMAPYVTIMVGRLDDHLKRVMASDTITTDPGCLEWAGVLCLKKAYRIFKQRGYRSTLLSAAYRNHMHWSEFLGGNVILSMPYVWWTRFNKSDVEVISRIDCEVDQKMKDELYKKFADFRRAYDEDGMKPDEFMSFGASVHTINQFISGYYQLLEYVRNLKLQ